MSSMILFLILFMRFLLLSISSWEIFSSSVISCFDTFSTMPFALSNTIFYTYINLLLYPSWLWSFLKLFLPLLHPLLLQDLSLLHQPLFPLLYRLCLLSWWLWHCLFYWFCYYFRLCWLELWDFVQLPNWWQLLGFFFLPGFFLLPLFLLQSQPLQILTVSFHFLLLLSLLFGSFDFCWPPYFIFCVS